MTDRTLITYTEISCRSWTSHGVAPNGSPTTSETLHEQGAIWLREGRQPREPTITIGDLVASHGSCRAGFNRTANQPTIHYYVMTQAADQHDVPVYSDVTHFTVADPDGMLWQSACQAASDFSRHRGNADEVLMPAGPTVRELVNGYRRPIPDPPDLLVD